MNAIDRQQLVELLDGSTIKPRLKRGLRFIPEEITDWADRDFLSITNRNRSEGLLIMPIGASLSLSPFQMQPRKPNKTGRIEAIVCDFCLTWQRGANSALISFSKREGSTVSYLCCGDLLCSLHVRDKTDEAKLSRVQLRETITVEKRIDRLRDRLLDKVYA